MSRLTGNMHACRLGASECSLKLTRFQLVVQVTQQKQVKLICCANLTRCLWPQYMLSSLHESDNTDTLLDPHLGILWVQFITTRSSRVDGVASKQAQDGCQQTGVVVEYDRQQRDAQPIHQLCPSGVPKAQGSPREWSHSLPGSCSWWCGGNLLESACPPMMTGRESHTGS